MFSGLVTAVGTVRTVARTGGGVELTIVAPYRGLELGESIAVDGVCLTVTAKGRGWLQVRAVGTTLRRTRFRRYGRAHRVNLERALRLGDRLGGHLVQGHVDGVGRVRKVTRMRDARAVELEVPPPVAAVSVPQGSIAVDGVSLTILEVPAPGIVQVALIPFTLQHTNLDRLSPGDEVHLEGDLIGKYVRHLLEARAVER